MRIDEPRLIETGCLEAIAFLFEELNATGIRYCHWKSNLRLGRSLLGKTDLDLLVAEQDAPAFRAVLQAHEIKAVRSAPGKDYPGIEHHLGYDRASGRIFDLHVHFRLVLGEQFVKNYHLPLETVFLEQVIERSGVKIPRPELELCILSLRALLKYRDRDGLKDMLKIRKAGIPAHIREEIDWLRRQCSPDDLAAALDRLQPVLPVKIIREFLACFSTRPRAGGTLLRLRQELRSALSVYQRKNRGEARRQYFQALAGRGKRRKMSLPRGLAIALVGVDGAGKSTVSGAIREWLGWRVHTVNLYLGRPERGWQVFALRSAARTLKKAAWGAEKLSGERSKLAIGLWKAADFVSARRYLREAKQKVKIYRQGLQEAARGSLVIFDRFPMWDLQSEGRPIDGPRLPAAHSLARQEMSLYQQIELPDRVIFLDLPAEVSLQRKPEHGSDLIREKNRVFQHIRSHEKLVVLNAAQPIEQVMCEVREIIWGLI